MKLSSLIMMLVLVPSTVTAYTLENLQKLALEQRQLIKKFQVQVEKSSEDVRIARSGYYPSLDLGYSSYAIDEPSQPENDENSLFSTTLSWELFSGYADKYGVDSARKLETVETYRLQAAEQDLQLSVSLSYLAVFNQRARLQVAEDSYKALEGLYLDSKNRFDVGLIDKNTVLKFKVDYDNARLRVKKEEADLRKALLALNRSVNGEINDDELAFREFNQMPVLGDRVEFESTMLATRSELKVLEGLAEAAELQVSTEYSSYYPSVNLIGRYRNYDDEYINGSGDVNREELRAELVLSINLFDGFSDEATIAKAKMDVRALRYDIVELQNDLLTDLKNLFVDYEVSLENVEVAKEDISFAEENLRVTELKYREGLQRQLDLLDALSNLSRAQSNYVAVVRTVFENYFRITRMVEGFSAGR